MLISKTICYFLLGNDYTLQIITGCLILLLKTSKNSSCDILRDMLETFMYSAISPLILLLVSSVWRYPAILEEVVKWGILRIRANGQQPTVAQGALVGLVFGLSEAMLYTMNAWMSGDWVAIGMRLILTVPMHTVTGWIIGWGVKKRLGWVWLGAAMILHAAFNYWIGLGKLF